MKRIVICICAIVALVVIVVFQSINIANLRKELEIGTRKSNLPAFGFDTVMADILWVGLIQYEGSLRTRKTEEVMDRLYLMYDQVTTLDPYFIVPYEYGGMTFLAEKPEYALRILDKGIRYNPGTNWKLPYYAGMAHWLQIFFKKNDNYGEAIRYFEMAREIPQHPAFLDRLVANLRREAKEKGISL